MTIEPSLIPIVLTSGPSMAIPAPYWLFTVLHWLTFALHLVAMNLLFGGVIFLLMLRNNETYREILFDAQRKLLPSLMAATITLGVAPLLFVQVVYGQFFYSATIISGWNWFLIIPVVIVTYYLLYAVALKDLSPKAQRNLLIFAALGLIYMSLTLTMVSDLTIKPLSLPELYQKSQAGTILNPNIGQVLFRWLHIVIGGFAVAALSLQLFALYHPKAKGNRDLLILGAKLFLMMIMTAAIFAIVYLFTLEDFVFAGFLKSPGTHAILLAIILNMAAAYFCYKAPGAAKPAGPVWSAAVLIFVSVFLMVFARHTLRLVYLGQQFDSSALSVRTQWGPFVLFLVVFLIGLYVLYWMFRRYFGRPQSA
jgi:hypothetical protein